MKRTIIGKDYRKTTFKKAGNYVKYAGGNAKQRNKNTRVPNLQKTIDKRRKEIGI